MSWCGCLHRHLHSWSSCWLSGITLETSSWHWSSWSSSHISHWPTSWGSTSHSSWSSPSSIWRHFRSSLRNSREWTSSYRHSRERSSLWHSTCSSLKVNAHHLKSKHQCLERNSSFCIFESKEIFQCLFFCLMPGNTKSRAVYEWISQSCLLNSFLCHIVFLISNDCFSFLVVVLEISDCSKFFKCLSNIF